LSRSKIIIPHALFLSEKGCINHTSLNHPRRSGLKWRIIYDIIITEVTALQDSENEFTQLQSILFQAIKTHFPDNPELVDNFAGMFQLFQRTRLHDDGPSRELGLSFLTEAQRDLETCEILHKKRLYAYAVYHLQQAVEKAAKGYLLGLGFCKAGELRELYGHLTPQLFIKALFDKTGLTSWAETLADETLKGKIDKAKGAISEEEKRIRIAKLSNVEIDRFLVNIERYYDIGSTLTTQVTSEARKLVAPESPTPSLWQSLRPMICIFSLAVITFPHEAYTRYPDGKMTPSDYNRDLGIVSATKKIARLLRTQIDDLKTIIRP
jgi:HEPN domain-containing protein